MIQFPSNPWDSCVLNFFGLGVYQECCAEMSERSFLSDGDWRNLLREIHSGQVIPVVGPGLVTIAADGSSAPIPLHW